MTKEFKTNWIAALRSGEYIQGEGKLYQKYVNSERWCCIGVGCHIVGIHKMYLLDHNLAASDDLDISIVESLPTEITGNGDENDIVKQLVSINDGSTINNIVKHNFNQIADWIELNIPTDEV